MTTGNKLHRTLANLRKAKGEMEAFAMDTQDQNAKQMFSNSAKQIGQLVNSLSGRTNYVEQQEPQYSTKQQQRQGNNNNQRNNQ